MWRRQQFERGVLELEPLQEDTARPEPTLARVGLVLRLRGTLPDDAMEPDRLVGNQFVVKGSMSSVACRIRSSAASSGHGLQEAVTPVQT